MSKKEIDMNSIARGAVSYAIRVNHKPVEGLHVSQRAGEGDWQT
jgi:hypothetical protein